jgi:hypothetical protein
MKTMKWCIQRRALYKDRYHHPEPWGKPQLHGNRQEVRMKCGRSATKGLKDEHGRCHGGSDGANYGGLQVERTNPQNLEGTPRKRTWHDNSTLYPICNSWRRWHVVDDSRTVRIDKETTNPVWNPTNLSNHHRLELHGRTESHDLRKNTKQLGRGSIRRRCPQMGDL